MIVKAKVIDGIVVESYLVDEVPEHLLDWDTLPTEAGPGWRYDGETLLPPTEEFQWDRLLSIRNNMKLSFAQLLIGLVAENWLTQSDATAWMTGTPPPPVLYVISQLPIEQQFAATVKATRPTEIIRTDPLVIALGEAQGKTIEEMDNFFITYSTV